MGLSTDAPDIQPQSASPTPPIMPEKPALPTSIMGSKIPEGAMIPQSNEEGKQEYQSLMPKIAATPGSADYFRERQEQEDFKSAHPWGDPISAHPGTLGKIGHVLGRIGNIAGDVLAPGTTSLIPGSDLNNQAKEVQNERGIRQGVENAGQEATTAHTAALTGEVGHEDPEEQAFTAAQDEISPVTGKKNSPLEAFRAVKQAGQKPTANKAQKAAHITYDQGIPVSVTDADQNVYDVNDPKLPPDLKPLVDSATRAHAQRNSEEEQKEGRVAERGASAQARTFAQQEKMHDEKQDDLTAATKSMVEAAPGVLNLSKRVRSLIEQQKGSLGPASGRWSEFMTGKVGAPNPDFARLRTDVGLLQTKLMRMHVGARGGEVMMQHFKDLIDTSKQSPENLEAALDEIDAYAKETGQQGKQKEVSAKGGQSENDPLGIR